ncbi:uncharacterized protein LOC123518101 isoform X2 [Portunus trituberculatus]|uniref:uncharacterized protein LOC123518101 isoform X2 n=1 Tax=Portunus trituberculatus TaxID=210409 RepID=UPI001E1D1A59|nr:uncharacterized protein LOC123518101 isoform X2 [Portunus trituberculatus]
MSQFSTNLFFALLVIFIVAFLETQCLDTTGSEERREQVKKMEEQTDQDVQNLKRNMTEQNEFTENLTRYNLRKKTNRGDAVGKRGEKKPGDNDDRLSDTVSKKKKEKKNQILKKNHRRISSLKNAMQSKKHAKVKKIKAKKVKGKPAKTKKRKFSRITEDEENRITRKNEPGKKKTGGSGNGGKANKQKGNKKTNSGEIKKNINTSESHPLFSFSNYLLAECGKKYKLVPGTSYLFTTDGGHLSRNCRSTFSSPSGTKIQFFCPVFNLHLKKCKKESLLLIENKHIKWPFCKSDVVNIETIGHRLQVHHKRSRLPRKKCPGAFLCEVTVHRKHGIITVKPPVIEKPPVSVTDPHPVPTDPHPVPTDPHPVPTDPHPVPTDPHPVPTVPDPSTTTATTKKTTSTSTTTTTTAPTTTSTTTTRTTTTTPPTIPVHITKPPIDGKPPPTVQHRPYCPNCNRGDIVITRIVGGMPARLKEFPFQARVMVRNKILCSGTLISSDLVLSAAHCFSEGYTNTVVFLGDHDTTIDEHYSQVIDVRNVIVHEDFNTKTMDNDIALVELTRPAVITPYVIPACIATSRDNFQSSLCVVSGWGHKHYGGSTSNELMKVGVDLITNEECQLMYNEKGYTITDNMICTYTQNKDACQGDSGGPLVRQTSDGMWVLIGIVSFGYKCAHNLSPGVFTKVEVYKDWISRNIYHLNC